MKPHLSLITLGVKDLNKSVDFYMKLGFPVEVTGDIAFIKLPTIWLALYGLEALAQDAGVANKKGEFAGITLAHNVISEAQVDQVIEEVRGLGATIVDEPHKREWGGYSGYFADPDGYLWEVAYNPYSPEIAIDEASGATTPKDEEVELMQVLYQKAKELVANQTHLTPMFLQRKLLIDFIRAKQILTRLKKEGLV